MPPAHNAICGIEVLPAGLNGTGKIDWIRARVDSRRCGATKGGPATGPSPVDRARTGFKHHLICDGPGTPAAAITTGAKRNDATPAHSAARRRPPVRAGDQRV